MSNVGILILQSETSDFAQRLRAQSDHSIITIEGADSSATKKLREEYLSLQGRCEKIFVVSVGIGSVSALAIGEEFTDQIDGIIIIDPISSSANRSSRKEYKDVFKSLATSLGLLILIRYYNSASRSSFADCCVNVSVMILLSSSFFGKDNVKMGI